jgi:hypothetical protein
MSQFMNASKYSAYVGDKVKVFLNLVDFYKKYEALSNLGFLFGDSKDSA